MFHCWEATPIASNGQFGHVVPPSGGNPVHLSFVILDLSFVIYRNACQPNEMENHKSQMENDKWQMT